MRHASGTIGPAKSAYSIVDGAPSMEPAFTEARPSRSRTVASYSRFCMRRSCGVAGIPGAHAMGPPPPLSPPEPEPLLPPEPEPEPLLPPEPEPEPLLPPELEPLPDLPPELEPLPFPEPELLLPPEPVLALLPPEPELDLLPPEPELPSGLPMDPVQPAIPATKDPTRLILTRLLVIERVLCILPFSRRRNKQSVRS